MKILHNQKCNSCNSNTLSMREDGAYYCTACGTNGQMSNPNMVQNSKQTGNKQPMNFDVKNIINKINEFSYVGTIAVVVVFILIIFSFMSAGNQYISIEDNFDDVSDQIGNVYNNFSRVDSDLSDIGDVANTARDIANEAMEKANNNQLSIDSLQSEINGLTLTVTGFNTTSILTQISDFNETINDILNSTIPNYDINLTITFQNETNQTDYSANMSLTVESDDEINEVLFLFSYENVTINITSYDTVFIPNIEKNENSSIRVHSFEEKDKFVFTFNLTWQNISYNKSVLETNTSDFYSHLRIDQTYFDVEDYLYKKVE